jgi:hypothetical protein
MRLSVPMPSATLMTSAPAGFADLREGVGVADLEGEEAVGGVLDELGAVDVGDEHGRDEGLIHFLHEGEGAVAVAADDDAIGLHEVLDGAAFTEEFGIADDIELDAGLGIAADGLGNALAGLDWDGALIDDDAVAIEMDWRSRGRPFR